MANVTSRGAAASKFGGARRKAVAYSREDLVSAAPASHSTPMPLVVSPNAPDVDFESWAASARGEIGAWLLEHGAILFRGFGLKSAADFERCARAVSPDLYGDYGDLPREKAGGAIYKSTPYPPEATILFHNEAAHTPRWPMKQFFFCVKAAETGGETPVVDCREVYRALDARVATRFEEKGLMYVRNFLPGLDVSWQDFFRTSERAEVEECCRLDETACEWKLGGEGLTISQLRPAVTRHPSTGEKLFFNQVQLHHTSSLSRDVREAMLAVFKEQDLPRNVYYGDGSPIEDEVMEEVGRAYWGLAVSRPWQEGDMLLLDNMLTAHARKPFTGERKIVVAMAEMFRPDGSGGAATQSLRDGQ